MNAPDRWDYTFLFVVLPSFCYMDFCDFLFVRNPIWRQRHAQVFDGSAPVFTWAMLYTVYQVVFEAQVYVDIVHHDIPWKLGTS